MNTVDEPKVICIGWHKTGTTTLGDALLLLGYEVLGARVDLADDLLTGNIEPALELAADFSALQDVPWNALYQELDQAFPGSRFILTVRDEDNWLKSAVRHFGARNYDTPIFQWLYGTGRINGNEQRFLERYQRHNREVREYFRDRPTDLLVYNLEERPGWEPLCHFLGKPIPNKPFPHSNPSPHSLSWRQRMYRLARNLTPLPLRRLRLKVLEKLGRPVNIDRFNNRTANRAARKRYAQPSDSSNTGTQD